jgi:murein L,D-transpeptidase YcbB/YkuD
MAAPPAGAAAVPAMPAPVSVAMPALRPEQAARLIAELETAPNHGFAASDYRTDGLKALVASGDPRGQAELINMTLRYAQAQRGGRINPTAVSTMWAVAPPAYEPRAELARAIAEDRLDDWLASLPPPYQGYRNMTGALAHYRRIEAEGSWGRIADGAALRPGASDPRVPALRERLKREGYGVGSGTGATYDAGLVDAVKRFQGRRGLGADGVVAGATLAELNVSAARRAGQIEANLERWRWLPRALPEHRIEVNLPTAMLDYYRAGRPHETMRVVVGGKKSQTPIMTANITAVTFNPPWNVPLSIVKNEIAPRLARDPGYMARQGLKKVGEFGNGLPMLQQAAGPKSALGRVKFESPNEFAVFLHDTPSRGGFNQADRLLSHGCVRLQKPLELAKLVLEDNPDWTPQRMEEAIAAGKTVRASVPEPIPMYLLYWTSFVDEKGGIHFREDIYDWDARLTAALDKASGTALASR